MSAIGDYIHLNWKNYEEYGTARVKYKEVLNKTSSLAEGLRQIGDQRKKFINLTRVSGKRKSDLEDLENFLNYIQGKGIAKEGYPGEEELQKYWNELCKDFAQEFNVSADIIKKETFNVDINGKLKSTSKNTANNPYIKTILNMINNIDDLLEELSESDNINMLKRRKADILSRFAKIIDVNEQVLLHVKTAKTDSKISRNYTYYKNMEDFSEETKQKLEGRVLANKGESQSKILEFASLQKDLNVLLGECRMSSSRLKGSFFEYIIGALPYMMKQSATIAAYNSIYDAAKGANRGSTDYASSVKIDANQLYGYSQTGRKALDDIYGEYYSQVEDSNIYASSRLSQNKVDVDIIWNDSNFKVSAKNIDFDSNRDITLVKGTSLLNNLLSFNDNRYVNHAINMIVEHRYKDTSNYKQLALNSLQVGLLSLAFKGYKKGEDQADTFIINDNSGRGVKVIDIDTIINQIVMNAGPNNISHYVFFNDEFLKMKIENNKIHKKNSGQWANKRITKILSQLHKIKLHIALKPNAISDFYGW